MITVRRIAYHCACFQHKNRPHFSRFYMSCDKKYVFFIQGPLLAVASFHIAQAVRRMSAADAFSTRILHRHQNWSWKQWIAKDILLLCFAYKLSAMTTAEWRITETLCRLKLTDTRLRSEHTGMTRLHYWIVSSHSKTCERIFCPRFSHFSTESRTSTSPVLY